jgi:transposase
LAKSLFSANLGGHKEVPMEKKYIVRLSKRERFTLKEVVKKLGGSGQKIRRAQIMLKADVAGPAWTDDRIADAFGCRRQTVELIRRRLVESGFQETLDGKMRVQPPVEKLLDGEQEAKIIATRLGPPPRGYGNWTLRLLARKVVELEIADSVSYETVRRLLKKTGLRIGRSNTG